MAREDKDAYTYTYTYTNNIKVVEYYLDTYTALRLDTHNTA